MNIKGINIYRFPRKMRQYQTFPTLAMFPRKDLSECDDGDLIIHVAKVISVLTWQTFRACVVCKAKLQTITENLDSCTKREMQQKLARCPISFMAELLISLGTDNHTL